MYPNLQRANTAEIDCGEVLETSVLTSPQEISDGVFWVFTISIDYFYTNKGSSDKTKDKQYSGVSRADIDQCMCAHTCITHSQMFSQNSYSGAVLVDTIAN